MRLVILGRGQCQNSLAIGDRQDAHLGAFESLLDHHVRARFTEFVFATDSVNRFERVFSSRADDDPFAAGQSIRFDDQRRLLLFIWIAGFDVPHRAIGIPKRLVVGRWHVGLSQQELREDLASFQLGCGLARTKSSDLFLGQRIDNSKGQWAFRADDDQVDFVFLGKRDDTSGYHRRLLEHFRLPRRFLRYRAQSRVA